MKKMLSIMICLLTVCGLISGCFTEKNSEYMQVIEEYKEVFLPMDEDGFIYEETLKSVGKYVSGESKQEETMKVLSEGIETLKNRKNGLVEYDLDEEKTLLLEQCDIIPEEFKAFVDMRENILQGYIGDLETIQISLDKAEELDFEKENVVFWQKTFTEIYDICRGYYFYGNVNYWFAGWDEKNIQLVEENVIPEIKSYILKDYAWETDREIIMQKTERYLEEAEEKMDLISEYIGRAEEALLTESEKQ